MKKGIEIFVSYAPQDEKLRDELINHLSVWEEQGLIVPWHNRDISAGTDWQREIDTHLKKALVILLLISPDFMASNYRNSTEVKQAMRRHVSGDAQVIPINLRPVSWKDAPFGNLQALPRDAKAITLWPNRDEAFEQVAAQIKVVVEDLLVERYLKEAEDHLQSEDYTQAIDEYKEVLALHPETLLAYQGMGKALASLGQYEEALTAYDKALRLDPNSPLLYREKGDVLLKHKQHEKALAAYEEALRIDSQSALEYVNKGYALVQLQRYGEALEAYEHALHLDIEASSAYGEKGDALEELRRLKAILEQLLPSLQLTQQESSRSSLTPVVKVAPSVGTLLVTYHGHDGSVLDVAWLNEENIFSIGNALDAANRVTPPLPPGTRARTPPITRGNINIWRAMIGRTLWFSTINSAETVAWSRDRQRFAVTITDAARDPATLSTEANSIKIILGSDPSSNRKIQIWQQNSHSPSSPPGSVLQYYPMSQIIQKSDGSQESRLIEIYGAMSAAWSQEGRYIILVTQQGQLGVYDITTQQPLGFPLSLFTFTRVTSTRGGVGPQPIEYRQPVNNTVQNTLIESAVSSPSGNYVAACSVSDKREMQVWEVLKGQTGIFTPQVIRTYSGSPAPSGEVIWSPDEKFLVFASSNHVYAWEPASGKTTLMYRGHDQDVAKQDVAKQDVAKIAWSPTRKHLASVSGGSIHVWEATTGRTSLIYNGHFKDVTCIAWSPDGTRIASGSHDETVQVWLAAEG